MGRAARVPRKSKLGLELEAIGARRARLESVRELVGEETLAGPLFALDAEEKRTRAQMAIEERLRSGVRRPWLGVAAGVTEFGAGRRRKQPLADFIARAQRRLWRRKFSTLEEALTHCWACTSARRTEELEKAHIQPVRFGGTDDGWNLLLLCSWCHLQQNDEASRAEQLRWLREHPRSEAHNG